MKRWFFRLGGLLLWPVRTPGHAWRALKRSEPFPGVSWGYLLRFARLPLVLVGIVIGIYVLGLVTFISPASRWSAAEVFVGLAGGGAALAALAGLAKQFERPAPDLVVEFDPINEEQEDPGADQAWLRIRNDGDEPAVLVRVWLHQLTPNKPHQLEPEFSLSFQGSMFWKVLAEDPIHRRTTVGLGVFFLNAGSSITVQSGNGRSATWSARNESRWADFVEAHSGR